MGKTSNTTDVEAALDLLATQVREEIMRIRDEGADAMKQGDYDTAKSVIEFAGKLESFAGDVDKLVGQWNSIAKQHDVEPETVKAIVGKTFFQRARKGTISSSGTDRTCSRGNFPNPLSLNHSVKEPNGIMASTSSGQ